jgi:hypothetical protein
MGIFKVIAFGLLIVMLKFLVPEIYQALESTLLVFFGALQKVLANMGSSGMTAGFQIQ